MVSGTCTYNGSNACDFAIAVGVIGFLFCLAFLVKDVMLVVIDYSNSLAVSVIAIDAREYCLISTGIQAVG